MAGLVPAIHVLLIEDLVQVLPIRVHTVDQADLPGTWPVLDVLLTLNGAEYRFVVLAPHEALEAIPSGEACDDSLSMLPGAPRDVARHASVENAVGLLVTM